MFDNMIVNMLEDLKTNPARLLSRFGAGDKTKLFPIARKIGKLLNKLTVGWQSKFYDHIIRDEYDYMVHLQYIDENPAKWHKLTDFR